MPSRDEMIESILNYWYSQMSDEDLYNFFIEYEEEYLETLPNTDLQTIYDADILKLPTSQLPEEDLVI